MLQKTHTKQRSSAAEPHEVVLEPLSISLSELILFRWSPTLGIHASDTSPRWTRKTDRERQMLAMDGRQAHLAGLVTVMVHLERTCNRVLWLYSYLNHLDLFNFNPCSTLDSDRR